MIACVYVPSFVAALERTAHGVPAGVPLVVRAAAPPGRVVAMCDRARERGVRAGMAEALARSRCPESTLIVATPARYERASEDVTALLSAWSSRVAPGVESWRPNGRGLYASHQPGAGWWLADLGRVGAGGALEWAAAVARAMREHARLDATVAVAPTRFTAWCAARGGGGFVPAERAASTLAPLPIELLPLDEAAAEWLHLLGLRTLGQLAALPAGALETQLGAAGRLLRQLALGRDHEPVPPYVPRRRLRAARHADGPVVDRHLLRAALDGIAAQLAARLERRGASARTVHLCLHIEHGAPWEDTLVLQAPASQVEPLRAALRALLERAGLACGVEHVEVVLGDLKPLRGTQLGLFDTTAKAGRPRREVVANLVARFGARRFFGVAARQRDARLLEWRWELVEP